jgi:hypothetical protein
MECDNPLATPPRQVASLGYHTPFQDYFIFFSIICAYQHLSAVSNHFHSNHNCSTWELRLIIQQQARSTKARWQIVKVSSPHLCYNIRR